MTLLELIVVFVIVGLLIGLLLPALHQAREGARCVACASNLRQVGMALMTYQDASGRIPNQSQMAWQTALLPHVEQGDLYRSYRRDLEPWAAENAAVVSTTVPVYLCPSAGPQRTSTAWGLSDFPLNGEFVDQRLSDVSDGTSQTVWLCDLQRSGERASVWALGPLFYTLQPATGVHGGQHVGFADGSVRLLPRHTSQAVLDALMTLAGGETLPQCDW